MRNVLSNVIDVIIIFVMDVMIMFATAVIKNIISIIAIIMCRLHVLHVARRIVPEDAMINIVFRVSNVNFFGVPARILR